MTCEVKPLDALRQDSGRAHNKVVLRSAQPRVKNRYYILRMYRLTDSGRLVLRVRQPVAPLREELEGDGSIPEDDNPCASPFTDIRGSLHAVSTRPRAN